MNTWKYSASCNEKYLKPCPLTAPGNDVITTSCQFKCPCDGDGCKIVLLDHINTCEVTYSNWSRDKQWRRVHVVTMATKPQFVVCKPCDPINYLKFKINDEMLSIHSNIKEWRISLWWLVSHVSSSHTWMTLPHVSSPHGRGIHVWELHSRVGATHVWKGHSRVGATHVHVNGPSTRE